MSRPEYKLNGRTVNFEWDTFSGKCIATWYEIKKCPNHENPYTDEYGSWVHCGVCRGGGRDGTIMVRKSMKMPEYNAPIPDPNTFGDKSNAK